MTHAVINHFEAIKIQKKNREQSVLAPFRMLDKPPQAVDKKQPVWKAGKRIGHLSLCDVCLRASHS